VLSEDGLRNPLEGLRIIRWLDNKRWQSQSWSWNAEWAHGLSPDQAIITHWLTYITDRQMPAFEVWNRGAPVFRAWVAEYSKRVEFKPRNWYSKGEGFKDGHGEHFKSRYHSNDFKSIQKTLTILRSYDNSLVRYVAEFLEQNRDDREVLRRLACALFLLTYESKSSSETAKILEHRFDSYYDRWKDHRWSGKKRLWAALRDYVKLGSDGRMHFIKALTELGYSSGLIQLYSSFGQELRFLDQLELPGDVWNNNRIFVENYLKRLGHQVGIEVSDQDIRRNTVNKKVREICEKARALGFGAYPEQFDVTYSFVPRMCANPRNSNAKLCKTLCPLGTGDRFFLDYHSDAKLCLATWLLTGDMCDCDENEHEIFRNAVGSKTCRGCMKDRLL
jgi:hypothetical protein